MKVSFSYFLIEFKFKLDIEKTKCESNNTIIIFNAKWANILEETLQIYNINPSFFQHIILIHNHIHGVSCFCSSLSFCYNSTSQVMSVGVLLHKIQKLGKNVHGNLLSFFLLYFVFINTV